MDVVLLCENYVQVDALTVVDFNTDLKQTWTATKRTAYHAEETWN